MMRRCLTMFSVPVMLLILTASAFAQTVLFGPKTYTRTAGPPNQFTDTFTLPAGITAPYTLHVVNGNANGTNRVSSATVTLNGTQILGPSDFGQNVAVLDRTVSLQATNPLDIRLTSAPGSFIAVSVIDTSTGTVPTTLTPNPLNLNTGATGTLTATLAPAPTAAGTLAVSSANTVVATVLASVPFAAGQTSVPFPVTAVASGSTAVTVTLNGVSAASQVTVTPAPPTITDFTPTSGPVGMTVTITGTNFVNIQTVAFNGVAAVFTINNATMITAVVPSGATTGPIAVTTAAGAATSAPNFTVLVPPAVTSFTPTSGPVGTVVTITGTNLLGTGPGTTTVKFNTTNAIITAVTAMSLTTTVPQGATTGSITVTTPGGAATSPQPFTAQNVLDFTLMPLPGTVSVAHVGTTTYQVKVNDVGPSAYTGFVSLNVSGLPAGVTATFAPPQATVGQPSTLLLTSTATAVPGTYPLLIAGSGTTDGGIIQRTAQAQLTILPAGASTLSGRVLAAKDGTPIAGVTVKVNALTAVTDAGGNFLFPNVPAGPQIAFVDGETASNAQVLYPIVPIPVTIVTGQDNHLSWTAYLHEMSRAYTPINPSQDTVVTDPTIPNFALSIPAGAQIIGWDGQPNTQVSVAVVSSDRNALAPFPILPEGRQPTDAYLFNFGKPGGGNPTQPIPLTIPNTFGNEPGTVVDLYYYDESLTPDPNSNQWKIFGQGRVSEDGTKIISDPGVGIPKFCCGGGRGGAPLPPAQPDPDPLPTGTDPVILTSGQFIYEATDLVLPGRTPVVIRRAYRSPDLRFGIPPTVGIFGSFTTLLDYNETLRPPAAQLLPAAQAMIYATNFGQALFARQPDGIFINTTSTKMRGMVVTINPDLTRQIRMRDGSIRRFNANGFLIEMQDRTGNIVTIARASAFELIQEIREPSGRAITFQYDAQNRITQITDPIGRTVQYSYDAQGQLAQVRNPEGDITTYTYGPQARLLSIRDPRGITYLTNSYDNAGRVVQQTQVDGGIWTLAYTVVSNRVTQTIVTDPRGNQTSHRFNVQGGEVETIDPLGQVTRRTFDVATNLLQEVRDPLNRSTKFTYDTAGNVTAITDPNNHVTHFEYHPTWSRVTKMTDALNQMTEFTYDGVGNLASVKDPLNHVTTLSYNSFGQPQTVTDPLGQTTTFAYDQAGNLHTTTDALGNTTARTYDLASRLLTLTDPRGFATQFQYDGLNRVTQITDALNGLTGFTYDPNGNLLTVADAKNQTTTYTYDSMDRLATRKDALNRVENYQYDLAGNLTQFTDRKNQIATFQYDTLNRRTQATYPDATTTFIYDAAGRLMKASDTAPGAGAIDFTYDVLDRLIQETTPQGTLNYQYDVLGRRTQMRANGLPPTVYQYDAASRLTRVEQGALFAALGYDNANRRMSLGYSNGTTTSYSYDIASRLTNITHNGPAGLIEALTYSYDGAGNRSSVNRANGTASLVPSTVASATYDAANEQTQFAGATLTYDANGNLTSDGVNTYQWDARNRLIGISGGATASFVYDPLGRRASKTINGASTQFAYDGNDIAAEIGGGTIGANYLRSLNIDEPFIRQTSTGNEHYHTDALGSSLALSNAQGNSATTYTYEPFGKTAVTGISSNMLQYAGRENDGNGLYYFRSRYYGTAVSRFLRQDSLSFASYGNQLSVYFTENPVAMLGMVNLYPYVDNSPPNFTDPFGYAKGGEQKINVNLPDGRAMTKKTPLAEIEAALKKAIDLNWSKGTIDKLEGLRKVVKRGGTIAIIADILDPDPASAGENELLCQRGIVTPACQPKGSKSEQ